MNIKEIYKLNYMRNYWSYVGTLRNEKKFNLHDKVFFVVNGNELAKGEIVGVELPPVDNPDYKYKIKLPEELIRQRMDNDHFYKGENIDKVTLKCDSIFNTVEEAKESAIKQLDKLYKLQKEEIDIYFKQWDN